MPPKKRTEKKQEKGKVPRGETSRSLPAWEQPYSWIAGRSTQNQEGNLDHYAESVNLPVGILVGFLVPTALCADWPLMNKDQRFMMLVLFAATMISAFVTLILSVSFIQASGGRSVGPSSSSAFSTSVGVQWHSRLLYLFMYLSFMFTMFLMCVQSRTLRKNDVYLKLVFSLAVAGKLLALFPPTAKYYNAWVSSSPPRLHTLRYVAVFIALFGFTFSAKKVYTQGILVAFSQSCRKLDILVKKLRPSGIKKILGGWLR